MNVYECRMAVEGGWAGFLVIAAKDEAEAIELCAQIEALRTVIEIIHVPDVVASGSLRLLWDVWP